MSKRVPVPVSARTRLGLTLGALGLGGGYLAVWIPHDVAGLAILGVDFLTFIKLLPAADVPAFVRGAWLWCLPPFTANLALNQIVWYPTDKGGDPALWHWPGKILAATLALYLSLHVLPLDWKPDNLVWPSNRVQTAVFLVGVGLTGLGPLTSRAFMPRIHWWLPLLALGSLATIPAVFFFYLPFFSSLYGQALVPGPGFYLTLVSGLILISLSVRAGLVRQR